MHVRVLTPAHITQFSSLSDGPLNPSFFNDEFTEAVRIMEVDLVVLDPSAEVPPSPYASRFEANLDIDDAYPTIHFTGKSRGVHSGLSRMAGTVQMLRGGTVRWNFVSTVHTSRFPRACDRAVLVTHSVTR